MRSPGLQVFDGCIWGLGDVFFGYGAEFAADEVGGEAGAEEGAVERGDFAVVNFAAEKLHLPFDALADERSFVRFLGYFVQGGFDVAIRDAAGAEVAGDAEFALLARFGALPRELLGIAGVVNQTRALQSLDYLFHQRFVFRAPL